ncbi:PEGA domain-containing protein, partial [Parabacteroides distasonis]
SDLSARVHERKDGNDDPCALVKVMFPVEGAKFGGDIVGDVKYDTGVYWVYMIAGSKKITISHPQYIATTLDFSKYSIKGLQAQKTYIVKVKAGESKKLQSLTISFSPSNASVIIDGKMYPSNNGKVTGMFPVGRHEVMIAAIGYESYEGSVPLRESSPSNIQTTLQKSVNIDVSHPIEQNYNATNVNGPTSTEQAQNT